MTLQASLHALKQDAGEWQDTSEKLKSCADTVAGLTFSGSFSFMGQLCGTDTDYEAARAHVEEILRAGSKETHSIATKLLRVKSIYEGTDQAAKDKLAGTWDPVL